MVEVWFIEGRITHELHVYKVADSIDSTIEQEFDTVAPRKLMTSTTNCELEISNEPYENLRHFKHLVYAIYDGPVY